MCPGKQTKTALTDNQQLLFPTCPAQVITQDSVLTNKRQHLFAGASEIEAMVQRESAPCWQQMKGFDKAAGSHPLILGSSSKDEADPGEFRGKQEKSCMFGEIVHPLPVLLGFFSFVIQ